MTCFIDGIPYELREKTDLSFLRAYGQVFHVFDKQDSGNLCFGVNGPYGKLFIKYAGAQTVNYAGKPMDAAMRLKSAARLYETFRHSALTPLMNHGTVNAGSGYALIFRWIDGACLRPLPPDDAVLRRLRLLPLPDKLSMLDNLFDFHALVAEKGYQSVDFDDTNLLIDFAKGRCFLCDIDRYAPRPLQNPRGRMPGRSLFRAPECFIKDAPITETAMVYEMGVLSHLFLGDPTLEDKNKWDGPDLLRRVAAAALNTRPEDRYPSMRTFLHAWRTAVRSSWIY